MNNKTYGQCQENRKKLKEKFPQEATSRLSHQDFVPFTYRKLCLENSTMQLASHKFLRDLLPITATSSYQAPDSLPQPSSPILLLPTFSAPQWASLSWFLMLFHTAWHYLLIFLPVFDTCFYFWVKILSICSVLHHLNLPPDLHQVAWEMGWDN